MSVTSWCNPVSLKVCFPEMQLKYFFAMLNLFQAAFGQTPG